MYGCSSLAKLRAYKPLCVLTWSIVPLYGLLTIRILIVWKRCKRELQDGFLLPGIVLIIDGPSLTIHVDLSSI